MYLSSVSDKVVAGTTLTAEAYNIATGEASKDYILDTVANGTYYVLGIYRVGILDAALFGGAENGDKRGEYSDGLWEGDGEGGAAQAITYTGSALTGLSFNLGTTVEIN